MEYHFDPETTGFNYETYSKIFHLISVKEHEEVDKAYLNYVWRPYLKYVERPYYEYINNPSMVAEMSMRKSFNYYLLAYVGP
jgi:hypothetical protein